MLNEKSRYIEYRFDSSRSTHAHSYLLVPLLSLLGSNKTRIILDVGCGNGALAKTLLTLGYNTYGTDASAEGIHIAQREFRERFALQNLESGGIPKQFENIKFNTLIATEVIEHLYNPRKLVQFAKNLLEANGGGEFIISTPYHGYLKNLMLSLANSWDKHLDPLWDGGHIKMWSRKTLTRLLEEEGFQVTDFKGCGRLPYLWKSMIIKATINP